MVMVKRVSSEKIHNNYTFVKEQEKTTTTRNKKYLLSVHGVNNCVRSLTYTQFENSILLYKCCALNEADAYFVDRK